MRRRTWCGRARGARTPIWLPLAVLLTAGPASGQAAAIPDPLDLEWCRQRAAAANPELQAAEARADAAAERVLPAGALDDPRLQYEASNVPIGDFDFDSTPLSGQQFGIRQRLPFPGLRSARRDAARAGARAARDRRLDADRTVAARVEAAWADLAFAQRALEITDRNLEVLRQLARVAKARYGVGSGLQQDVLRAQVELTGLLQERLRLEADRTRAEARLAALLDLPPGPGLPRTAELAESAPLPELERLLARLEQSSPLLRSLAASIDQAERHERVAELEGYPDLDVGLGYRLRRDVTGDPVDGDDFVSLGFTIRLPVDRSVWRARKAERSALARGARADYRAARARLAGAVEARFSDLARADAEISLLATGLIPQARQSFESSRSGYEVGRIDFLGLLDSQVRLLQAELKHVRALADRRIAFADLESAIGESLR